MSTNESETEMTERETAGDDCKCWVVGGKPYIGIHTPGGSYEYNPECPRHGDPDAPDVIAERTERTYTREEIKNAFRNAYAWGWYDACAEAEIKHRIDMGPPNERRAKQHSPYEQEEALSTSGAREVPYHRNCTFDGGDPHGPLCLNPAIWHVLHTEGNRFAPYLACLEHLSIILPGAVDFHTVGECCGEPGAKWQFRHVQGEGLCSQDGDGQRLSAELFAPDEMKR